MGTKNTTAKNKNKTYKLTICSPQTQVSVKPISVEEFERLTDGGITEEEYEELQEELDEDSEFCYPIYDWLEIAIDDEVLKISEKTIDGIYQKAKKEHKEKNQSDLLQTGDKLPQKISNEEYYVIWDKFFKRAFFELTINEKFDINKLTFEIVSEKIPNGLTYEGFTPYYDDCEIEFTWSHDWNSDDLCIFNSSGKSYGIEIKYENEDD